MARSHTVFTSEAKLDIAQIYDRITADTGIASADKFIERVFHVVDLLADTSGMGRVRDDLAGEPRSHPVPPWVIIYDPLPNGQGVEVLRVIHGHRDIPHHFKR